MTVRKREYQGNISMNRFQTSTHTLQRTPGSRRILAFVLVVCMAALQCMLLSPVLTEQSYAADSITVDAEYQDESSTYASQTLDGGTVSGLKQHTETIQIEDEETGEETIVDYKGNFILFNNETMCEYCGDMDYSTMTRKSTKRKVAVIEDIAYIINDLLDKQEEGELPVELLFVWDSVGSITSWKSYSSKAGNNMFDASSISTAFMSIINTRIPSSRSQKSSYTNTFFIVNKIWDSSMATMGKPSVKLKGGNAFEYALRLLISCGKIVTSGVKKLTATVKGENYEYGTVAPIAIKKNHLPTPYNISREGMLYCVNNGIIKEDEIPAYKKKILPEIIEQLRSRDTTGKFDNVSEDDVTFSEEEDDTL